MTASTKPLLFVCILVGALQGCDRPPPPPPMEASDRGKIEGPDVALLSRAQLESTLKECMQYGRTDDPRVKYTPRYCSAVMTAHLRLRDDPASSAPVDPA